MELFEEAEAGNAPAMSVSELSGALKRVVEGAFGRVRVRGELGRVLVARSGHVYFDLKDESAVLSAVSWKGQAARLSVRPEEGMEVIATGRLTTFPGQSRYQLIVEDIVPAGTGALMAMLEKRRAALAAEGLFDADRKKPLPYLPRVIGVVTSPQGAVIRDILHRLRERFPVHVLIWPVAVQGERCAPEVARAIAGFNALAAGGPVPRPDLLIVARGGGSVEDLWGFNDEAVVRAAAASAIPLISAVGHETDTTLIDHAADRRAPTPTAAAEIAVPVRADLLVALSGLGTRLLGGQTRSLEARAQRLRDLARALPRGEDLVARREQRLDELARLLPLALRSVAERAATRLGRASARLHPATLRQGLSQRRERLDVQAGQLARSLHRGLDRRRERLADRRLRPAPLLRRLHDDRERCNRASDRLVQTARAEVARLATRLEALERLRQSLGPRETLERGYAVVRAGETVVSDAARARAEAVLEIEFRDGRVAAVPQGTMPAQAERPASDKSKPRGPAEGGQGSLF